MEFYKSKYSDKKKSGRFSKRENETSRSFRNSGNSRYSRDDRQESTSVTCADCGDQCEVPFVPRTDKPVYCNDCFRQNKPRDSGNSRYSRDDRNSRYSRDDRQESGRGNSRTKKLKNDKLSKKQASFFSNGSDKFYETIKEKIFEILGGKTCSNCGFKDERALGIRPVSDDISFDNNGRGGEASSWGKYISSPDLARAELKVLCLNCNEIRQPITKPKEDKPKSKKSKYFPR
ncbi:MAG: hypothetical protein MAG458_00311 [Nitrosopumilus sp.]|nr:hypothetical protein [Nitrosopumilus sp.]